MGDVTDFPDDLECLLHHKQANNNISTTGLKTTLWDKDDGYRRVTGACRMAATAV